VLSNFWEGKERTPGTALNIIPGFDGYSVGNNREIKRMLDLMGVEYTILSDTSDVYDTPTDGTFRMYDGGTRLEDVEKALNAKATLSLQQFCTDKSLEYIAGKGQETAAFHYPVGVTATDEFLMKVSELTGKPIPAQLELERGRLVDAMADSLSWTHGKTFAIYGDPDFVLSMTRFVMEIGGEPVHLLSTNGGKDWTAQMENMLASNPLGAGGKAWAGKDLWHMRSLMATEPVDLLIGNSHGKYLERDTGTPLIRLSFPIFDRHHHHRFPTLGYQGGLRVLVTILDEIFDKMDADTAESGISFDLTR
ncbi:MAG: nitrogenase molybdenum-iron protein subunit beta, partial [Rhodospirillales bacterium]|nr:nitrogenase molybdenum-iron protein subunit beta [Rhodospirillales bacterium]